MVICKKSRLLFWGYSYTQERNFKNLRERRTTIHNELMEDALRAGMILQNRADDTLTIGHRLLNPKNNKSQCT